jgi:hypothetical protein
MEDEHCAMAGHDVPFITENYGLTTTPQDEFNITVHKAECPGENMLDKTGKPVRVIRRIEKLKEEPLVKKAELRDEEIFSVVSSVLFCSLTAQHDSRVSAGAVHGAHVPGLQRGAAAVSQGGVRSVSS